MYGRRMLEMWLKDPFQRGNRSRTRQVDRAAGHGVCTRTGQIVRLYGAVGLFLLLACVAHSAEPAPASPGLLSPNAALVLELRQPQALFQHAFLNRITSVLNDSRAFRAALGSPDLDLARDAITHFETEFGLSLPQIIEACTGDGIVASITAESPPEIGIVVTGRDAERVKRLPDVVLSLVRKIVAGRGVNLPDPVSRTYQQHTYYQLGDGCYAVVGTRWLVASRPSVLEGMLDRLDGRQPTTNSGISTLLTGPTATGTAVRIAADLKKLQLVPGMAPLFKWPPPDVGQLIVAGGWFDLVQRSDHLITEIDLSGDAIQAHVRFTAAPTAITPGVVGFFASEPATAAAPLLEPGQLIYSASWYRDYWKMWEQRESVPLKEQVQNLEKQLASAETGNLGYSAFDILRLLGPHLRFVVTRPTTNPYRVEVADRLPAFAIVFDIRNEAEFREKVLPPIQRILGIVALTNKMIAQNSKYKTAEVSTMKFAEDAASIQSSDRVRYNFEPAYALTRGHLTIGSTGGIVRNLIDELDRLESVASTQSPTGPGPTERQIVRFAELAGVVTDVFGLSVRNAVLNDGLTIAEAGQELAILQKLVSALGQLQVQAGFDQRGFEYRIQLVP